MESQNANEILDKLYALIPSESEKSNGDLSNWVLPIKQDLSVRTPSIFGCGYCSRWSGNFCGRGREIFSP
jgi:hypothetical protein